MAKIQTNAGAQAVQSLIIVLELCIGLFLAKMTSKFKTGRAAASKKAKLKFRIPFLM